VAPPTRVRCTKGGDMTRTLLPAALVAALALAAAAPAGDKAGPKDNTPPEGFTALFNGKDLTGWQGLVALPQRAKLSPGQYAERVKAATAKAAQHWVVKDGVLHYDGKNNNLQTAKDYGDIELFVDWKIRKKGDSGIYLRGNPQVQIWDNPEGSGGLYNNQKNPRKPRKFADRPVGEWNTFRIVMRGDRVTIWLNGELVVDNTPLENYWDKGKKPLPATGPIELQHHGDPLWFKNIYIKELPSDKNQQQPKKTQAVICASVTDEPPPCLLRVEPRP